MNVDPNGATPPPASTMEDPRAHWARLRPALFGRADRYPHEVVREALAHRETLAPLWVEELEAFARDTSLITDDCVLHFHLIVMLAACRDTRAFAPLLALCRQDEATADALFGDFVTESMGRALASVAPEDIQPLVELSEAPEVSVWMRGAAQRALVIRVMAGDFDRSQACRILLESCEREAARLRAGEADDDLAFNNAVGKLCDLCCVEAEPALLEWDKAGFIGPGLNGDMAAISRLLRREFRTVVEERRRWRDLYISDPAAELQHWQFFKPVPPPRAPQKPVWQPAAIRSAPKVGRNDPCPCGSGKKFKKCCGA